MNKKVKIVLNSIFGNEEHVILRMLESCYKYIDYWVVQCNGQDKTKEIIDSFFKEKNIPGFSYCTEWDCFGVNRNDAIQKCINANHGCDWILRMDADERLEIDDDFDWSILEDLSVQSYNITAVSPGSTYLRTWMWNANLPWKFRETDKRHECILLPGSGPTGEEFQRLNLPRSFRHVITNDGKTWTNPTKFLTDALELENVNVSNNTLLDNPYHFFYIGKSYNDCYSYDSFPLKEEHQKEYARRCIFYLDQFVSFVNANENNPNEMAYYSKYLVGNAYRFCGDYEKAIDSYLSCEKLCYSRNEHLCALAEIYLNIDKSKMYEFTSILMNKNRNNPFPNLCFLLHNNCYKDTSDYPRHLHDLAISAYNPSGYGLRNLLEKDKVLKGVEIGCLNGDTTEYLLNYFPNLKLFGVDPYCDYTDWNDRHLTNRENSINLLYKKVEKFEDRFTLLKETSNDALSFFDDEELDLVFIDGLHTYEQVLTDCKNYYKKLKPGGVFSGHDYKVIKEVKTAVDEFANLVEAKIELTDHDIWYWRK